MQNHFIKLSVSEGVFLISPGDIIRLQASSNYTLIYFSNRRPLLIAKVLREFEAQLQAFGFIRTHRTHLVNSSYIAGVHNCREIIMTDQSVAQISKRMKTLVLQRICAAA